MKREEHIIQCSFMEIVSYTTLKDYIFAIPNGGLRNVIVASQMKREGVKKGVSDVFVSLPSAHYHGFYVEFKSSKGALTDEQAEFCQRMTHVGFLCQVFSDAREAYETVKQYSKNEVLDIEQWKSFVRKKRVKKVPPGTL